MTSRLDRILRLLLLMIFLVSCKANPTPTSRKFAPEKGQPDFPKLGMYWVIDNGCRISEDTLVWADAILQKLKEDHVAEVAIVCQTGIQNNGPMNDEKIWLLNWARSTGIGDLKERRGLVWLIRPDVRPEENRVTVTVSDWLPWYTALDYAPTLEEAGKYANYDNFDGAVEAITRGVDSTLRELWKTKGQNQLIRQCNIIRSLP